MKITTNKIKAIGKTLGVNIKIDKTLDNISKAIPDKMKETERLMANSTFTF